LWSDLPLTFLIDVLQSKLGTATHDGMVASGGVTVLVCRFASLSRGLFTFKGAGAAQRKSRQ